MTMSTTPKPPPSPEFQFNPSLPQAQLLAADDLIVDGVLLPLDLLRHNSNPVTIPDSPSLSTRFKDLFRLPFSQPPKPRTPTSGSGSVAVHHNLKFWPFTRSKSTGNYTGGDYNRKKSQSQRKKKVNSAPCSRCNSRGEHQNPVFFGWKKTGSICGLAKHQSLVLEWKKSGFNDKKSRFGIGAGGRRWTSSPGRSGIPVGRSSPVWHVRKVRGSIGINEGNRKGGVGIRVLNLM